jgi:tRNA (adenine-N(1)-)-methyltransferase non-catalytic subunit
LIIATGAHPLHILKNALRILAPGSPVVVYCEYSEPLVECYSYLHQEELAIRLQLVETILREFQTLPGQMHPLMKGSATGGFVLYGTFVGSSKLHAALLATKIKEEEKEEKEEKEAAAKTKK